MHNLAAQTTSAVHCQMPAVVAEKLTVSCENPTCVIVTKEGGSIRRAAQTSPANASATWGRDYVHAPSASCVLNCERSGASCSARSQRDVTRFSCRFRKLASWDRNQGFCLGGYTRRASAGIHRWSRNKYTGSVRPYRHPRSASEPKLQDRHPSDPTFHAYELLGARRGDASANPYPPRYFTLLREVVALLLWALEILGTSWKLSIDLDQ